MIDKDITVRISQEDVRRANERRRIGALLKAERERQGMSGRDLAKKCGISQSHIARIESGRYNITIDILSLVAESLGKKIKIE